MLVKLLSVSIILPIANIVFYCDRSWRLAYIVGLYAFLIPRRILNHEMVLRFSMNNLLYGTYKKVAFYISPFADESERIR